MRTCFRLAIVTAVLVFPTVVLGGPIPLGWACSGDCGTLGTDGDVTAPPLGGNYEFVSTAGSPSFAGLNLGFNETNGSLLTSSIFSASGSSVLELDFNFITSDGAGYPEYAYARLVPSVGSPVLLFTARTCETTPCNTLPGNNMPPLGAGVVVNPSATPIIANKTVWSPLGLSSGQCWNVGCGNSGWIDMKYTPAAGEYRLEFGVVNVNDTLYDSGLAVAGVSIGGRAIDPPPDVPEPSTLVLFGSGLLLVARRLASRHGR